MSYIQSTLKCDNCGFEMNVATGTFGTGIPEKCPKCGDVSSQFTKIADGWTATTQEGE